MEWYERHYKKLFLIPIVLLVLSIGVIANTTIQTGTFVEKGVSLSGGVSATVTVEQALAPDDLEDAVNSEFPQADVDVRALNTFGTQASYVVDAAHIAEDEQEAADLLEAFLRDNYAVTGLTTETTGPSLGEAFFHQTIIGILLAFLWMGWVVYLYFGDRTSMKILMALIALVFTMLTVNGVLAGTTGILILAIAVLASMVVYFIYSVPSGAVILAAASTILFTLAAIDLLGVRLSTAGVAAFLMLIGYSVDTDILLSTRVLRRHKKSLGERIKDAFTTGITMQGTTTIAVLAALLLASSEVIRQIMLIILIGMVADVIFTWLQNAGIIYWYVERNTSERERKARRKHA